MIITTLFFNKDCDNNVKEILPLFLEKAKKKGITIFVSSMHYEPKFHLHCLSDKIVYPLWNGFFVSTIVPGEDLDFFISYLENKEKQDYLNKLRCENVKENI